MTWDEVLRLAEAMYAIDAHRNSQWPIARLREAAQSIGMEIDGIESDIWWDAQCAYGQVWCAHNLGPLTPVHAQPVQLSLFDDVPQK